MVNHKQKRTRKVSRKVMRGGVGYKFNNRDVELCIKCIQLCMQFCIFKRT